jgi:hypothetical protein
MLPDSQETSPAALRSRVVEVIAATQEDALRQLRQAGVPETRALLIMRRMSTFCLQTLRELDLVFRQFDAFVAEDGRSDLHQQWLNDKAAVLLLQVEQAVAALVAEAIRIAIHEPDDQPEGPPEVITVPGKPAPSPWQQFLLLWPLQLVWVVGLIVWSLFALEATGGSGLLTVLAFVFALVLWRYFSSFWWGVLLALGVLVFIFLL